MSGSVIAKESVVPKDALQKEWGKGDSHSHAFVRDLTALNAGGFPRTRLSSKKQRS